MPRKKDPQTAEAFSAQANLNRAKADALEQQQRAEANAARLAITRATAATAKHHLSKIVGDGKVASGRGARNLFGAARPGRMQGAPGSPFSSSATGSANYQLNTNDRERMMARCTSASQNNGLYRTIMNRLADAVVGDGPVLIPQTSDEKWNETAGMLYEQRAQGLDVGGIGTIEVTGQFTMASWLRTIVRTICDQGDVLNVRTPQGNQLVEPIRVRNPNFEQDYVDDSGGLIGGVKINPVGRHVDYTVAKWDMRQSYTSTEYFQVSAKAANLILNPINLRVGQVRGEPAMQAVLDPIEQLVRYMVYTGLAAQIATWFGLVTTSQNPDQTQETLQGAVASSTTMTDEETGLPLSQKDLEMTAGWMYHAAPGDKVEQIKPEFPISNYRDYMTVGLMLACAEMGLPFPIGFFDGTQLSFAQLKSLQTIAQPGFWQWQTQLQHQAVIPDYHLTILRWMENGTLPYNAEWSRVACEWPGLPVLDLGAEIDGMDRAVKANYMTKEQVARTLGRGPWKSIARTRAKERDEEQALGIIPVELPGAKADGGRTAGKAGAPEKAPATGPAKE